MEAAKYNIKHYGGRERWRKTSQADAEQGMLQLSLHFIPPSRLKLFKMASGYVNLPAWHCDVSGENPALQKHRHYLWKKPGPGGDFIILMAKTSWKTGCGAMSCTMNSTASFNGHIRWVSAAFTGVVSDNPISWEMERRGDHLRSIHFYLQSRLCSWWIFINYMDNPMKTYRPCRSVLTQRGGTLHLNSKDKLHAQKQTAI